MDTHITNTIGPEATYQNNASIQFEEWFQSSIGIINKEVWETFFGVSVEDGPVVDHDIISMRLFLENNQPKRITENLKKIISQLKIKIEKQRGQEDQCFKCDKQDPSAFEGQLLKTALEWTTRTINEINTTSTSIQTILIGMNLFNQNPTTYNPIEEMKTLTTEMNQMLSDEQQLIQSYLYRERQRYISALTAI